MGTIIVQQVTSLDGYAADPDGGISFFGAVENWTETDRDQLGQLGTISHMVLGSTTYRMFADYWPTEQSRGEVIADKLNSLDKVVFSRSLDRAPWGDYPDAEVVSGDAAETVRRIADDAPGDVIVWGSLTLTDQLFVAGGVDRVQLRITPIVVGAGRGVFPEGFSTGALRLVESRAYPSGLLTVDYALT